MPITGFVVVGFFHVSAVPEWNVGGDFLDVEPRTWGGVGGVEDVVDFFEAAETRFRVKKVDYGKDYDVTGQGSVSREVRGGEAVVGTHVATKTR